MIAYHDNQAVLIQPSGPLDLETGKVLNQTFTQLEAVHHRLWILDLSQVDFIDSAGVSTLIAGLHLANKRQSRLVLHRLKPAVKLVLEITRLDQVFEIAQTASDLEMILNGIAGTEALAAVKPLAA
jgi:anti-sigma B factor antagonist